MFRKNTAGQFIEFQGVDATTGGTKSGVTWTVRRCIDGTFAAATGTVTEDGTAGWYKFAMSQADTNGNNVGFNFTGTGAVPQTVNIVTTAADPTDGVRFGLTALPNAAAGANTGLPVVGTQVPNATAGASGGLFIAGTNAATTVTTSFTTTFTGNLTGSVGSVTGNVTGSVGSVTGAVGSVTGNVGGNVVGSVASVTARVTANTDQLAGQTVTAAAGVTFPASVASPTNITAASGVALAANQHVIVDSGTVTTLTNLPSIPANWLTATGIAADAFTAAKFAADVGTEFATAVSGAVWDLATSGHTTSGTFGAAMNAAGSAGDPWATTLPGAYGAGTAGAILGGIPATLGVAGAGLTAITAKTDNLPLTPAAAGDAMTLTSGARTAVGTAVWSTPLWGTKTASQWARWVAAALFGKVTGGGVAYKDLKDGTTTVLSVVDDGGGDRTVTTTDPT